jgi:hypothetical protein
MSAFNYADSTARCGSVQGPGHGLGDRGSIPARGSYIFLRHRTTPAMGPTRPPIHGALGLFLGGGGGKAAGQGLKLTTHSV